MVKLRNISYVNLNLESTENYNLFFLFYLNWIKSQNLLEAIHEEISISHINL